MITWLFRYKTEFAGFEDWDDTDSDSFNHLVDEVFMLMIELGIG